MMITNFINKLKNKYNKSIRQRIIKQGVIRTLWYVITVFLLPKLGIDINFVYIKIRDDLNMNTEIKSDIHIDIIKNYEQLTINDVDALYSFEGDELLKRMKDDFEKCKYCIIGKKSSGDLVGVCWIEKYENTASRVENYLILDCFVLPRYRGNNYFTVMLNEAYSIIMNSSDVEIINVRANVNIGNKSSNRSFIKAGYKYSQLNIKLFRRWNLKI